MVKAVGLNFGERKPTFEPLGLEHHWRVVQKVNSTVNRTVVVFLTAAKRHEIQWPKLLNLQPIKSDLSFLSY